MNSEQIAKLEELALAAQHPDDIAVDKFAAAMKAKMALSRAKGCGGWDDPEECDVEDIACMLVQHVEKGDPVDIGNFCMMIWNRVRDTGPDTYAPISEALEAYNAPPLLAASQQAAEPVAWPDWLKIEADTLLIHGIRYSQELFQHFGRTLPLGEPFLIDGREKDGALTVLRLGRTVWPVADAVPAIQQPIEERGSLDKTYMFYLHSEPNIETELGEHEALRSAMWEFLQVFGDSALRTFVDSELPKLTAELRVKK